MGPSKNSRGSGFLEVWVSPNLGSKDFVDLAKYPEQWSRAKSRVTVIGFYDGQVRPGYCDICGVNTLSNFVNAVPGGFFQWLNRNGIKIAIETGSVKGWNCGRLPDDAIGNTLEAISSVEANGGRVSYIAMDEPFASGAPPKDPTSWLNPCGYGVEKTAEMVKYYTDGVNRVYPGVRIGLIEPYPHFGPLEIESFVNALEAIGVHLPFFHLDFDPNYRDVDFGNGIRELRDFFAQKGIPFGVIIIGGNGYSNESVFNGAMNMAMRVNSTIGLGSQDHLIVQSWLNVPGQGTTATGHSDLRLYPDNLPESVPATMTGTVNAIFEMSSK